MSALPHGVTIDGFRDEDAPAFSRLNRIWLEQHGLLEDGDLPHLDHPRENILDKGGAIFVARRAGEVIGTCAIAPGPVPGAAELIKLTTAPEARGMGIGRALTECALDWARARQLTRVLLLSSSKLVDALRLYERLGFRHRPLPPHNPYETADVFMELSL